MQWWARRYEVGPGERSNSPFDSQVAETTHAANSISPSQPRIPSPSLHGGTCIGHHTCMLRGFQHHANSNTLYSFPFAPSCSHWHRSEIDGVFSVWFLLLPPPFPPPLLEDPPSALIWVPRALVWSRMASHASLPMSSCE